MVAAQDSPATSTDPWISYPGGEGPGAGKHVVLIAGDEEYRSEEMLPQLGKILSVHHGFRCTVLFSTNPETGEIDPDEQNHIPGLEHLATADLAVVFLRFRELPDEDMAHFVSYVESGKPLLGVRTSTHAFLYEDRPDSPYARYGQRSKEWRGGFGREILGEKWVAHHGAHGREATLGRIEPEQAAHPILRGVGQIFGPTDVYTVRPPKDVTVLVRGVVLSGMSPDDPPVEGKKNDPPMPLIWTRELPRDGSSAQRVVCSTIGAADDFASEGLRRALVNSCYWLAGLEDQIPDASEVGLVGEYTPTRFGFGRWIKGRRASDHALAGK